MAIVPEEDEYEIITEELDGSAGGASTTASPGSGTAVGGGDSGMSFTSAMGVSVSGGDSGTAFATNSNVSGMGAIVSPQPSSTPGDVRGGTKGSGDIGTTLGTYTKSAAGKKRLKRRKRRNLRKILKDNILQMELIIYIQLSILKLKKVKRLYRIGKHLMKNNEKI